MPKVLTYSDFKSKRGITMESQIDLSVTEGGREGVREFVGY